MSWTAPRTWVSGEILTAALLNTHLRDNLLETAVAKAAVAGDIFAATGANALARVAGAAGVLHSTGAAAPTWAPVVSADITDGTLATADHADFSITSRKVNLDIAQSTVLTRESSVAVAYGDLATVGPAVTVVTGAAAQDYLILFQCAFDSNGVAVSSQPFASVQIGGTAASDNDAVTTNIELGGPFVFVSRISTGMILATGIASGTTFTMKYKEFGGGPDTWFFSRRRMIVIPL